MIAVREMLAGMSEHEQRFELLADLGAMIAGEVELDDLLRTFAARVARALGADGATLWLIDGATGEIRSRVATLSERSAVGRGHRRADRLSRDLDPDRADRAPRPDPRRAPGRQQAAVGSVQYA